MSASSAKPKTDEVKVTVTFPIAQGPPFTEDAEAGETLGSVRAKAMEQFGVAADSQHRYYLTRAGSEQPDAETVAGAAGHAHAVSFVLVKELVQG